MKTINFQINEELHMQMRLKAIQQGKSVKLYITELIEKDLQTKKEQTHAYQS